METRFERPLTGVSDLRLARLDLVLLEIESISSVGCGSGWRPDRLQGEGVTVGDLALLLSDCGDSSGVFGRGKGTLNLRESSEERAAEYLTGSCKGALWGGEKRGDLFSDLNEVCRTELWIGAISILGSGFRWII